MGRLESKLIGVFHSLALLSSKLSPFKIFFKRFWLRVAVLYDGGVWYRLLASYKSCSSPGELMFGRISLRGGKKMEEIQRFSI